MCKRGQTVPARVFIPARYSHSGADRWDVKPIDRCIEPIVSALVAAGVHTVGSCCGHGDAPGSIALEDGREILIARNDEMARQMVSLWKRWV